MKTTHNKLRLWQVFCDNYFVNVAFYANNDYFCSGFKIKIVSMKGIETFLLALLSIIFVACHKTETPILSIEGGKVQGVELTNSVVYRGIPYAAPPVGNLRWKRPQEVLPWDTVLIADTFAPAPIQDRRDPNDGDYGTEFYWDEVNMSEDCLYLNIWTPKGASGNPSAKLPVAIWIHGGSFVTGWGNEVEFDGEAWAERGVILVTFNYRLNIYGFLCHPLLSEDDENGVSGNYGLYDQAEVLNWVNKNIAQFGGDPNNVMLFGQSAGAMSVKYLTSSPLTRDLVAKAIVMSSGGLTNGVRARVSDQMVIDAPGEDLFNINDMYSLAEMRSASKERIDECLNNYLEVQKRAFVARPHIDGVLVRQDVDQAVYEGEVSDIPYILGYTADDIPKMKLGLEEFAAVRDSLSDKNTYLYLFDAQLPDDGRPCLKGSFHGSGLWYVFHTLGRSWRPFDEKDETLSNKMLDYWTNFAKYGNPNGKEDGAWRPATMTDHYIHRLEREVSK